MFEAIKNLFRPRAATGVFVGRRRTRDISYLAQSPTGVIGTVTRSVPAPKITSDPNDATTPVLFAGIAVVDTTSNTVRNITAADGGLASIDGIALRPMPFQAASGTNFGAVSISSLVGLPTSWNVDVMRSGPCMVYCNSATAPNATKKSPVCVWTAATTGTHQQGGFEITPSATVVSAPGTNTGNGTIGGLTVDPTKAQNGVYSVVFTAPTTFQVFEANGRELLNGRTGVAYNDVGVAFTITAGGTAFVAGDSFSITTTFQTLTLDSKSYFNGPGDSTGAIELMFNL